MVTSPDSYLRSHLRASYVRLLASEVHDEHLRSGDARRVSSGTLKVYLNTPSRVVGSVEDGWVRVGSARTLRQKFWLDVTWRQDLHADVAESVAWKPAPSRMLHASLREAPHGSRRYFLFAPSETLRRYRPSRGRRGRLSSPLSFHDRSARATRSRPTQWSAPSREPAPAPRSSRIFHVRGAPPRVEVWPMSEPADRSRGVTHEYIHETHRPARFVGLSSVRVRRRLVLTRPFGFKRKKRCETIFFRKF